MDKHFLSGATVWQTRSVFTRADGSRNEGTGESRVTIAGNIIYNDSYAVVDGKELRNRYTIRQVNECQYEYRSGNPDLGIQLGNFFASGNTLYSNFRIENSTLHGYEIIRREGRKCFANGALLDGENLINTWEAEMKDKTEINMSIRQATAEDAIPFDLLYLADPSEKAVADYLKRGELYLGLLSEKVIGEYVLLPTRPFTIELVNIAVHEDFQACGYGQKLVAHAIRMAREGGYGTLEVATANPGIGQMAFYQNCGFSFDYIDKGFVTRHYDEPVIDYGIQCKDMIRMAIDLH